MVQIFCKNNEKSEKFEFGTTLLQIYDVIKPNLTYKPVCAVVNNQIQGLTFRVFGSKEVEYLDYTSEIGRKVYMRSFTFVLYKAVEDLLPGVRLVIEAPVSKGYFFTLRFTETNEEYPVSLEIVQRLKTRIKEILAENHRFHRIEAPTAEVAKLFRERGMEKKAKLVEGIGRLYCYYYKLADTVDYFYGPLVPSTEFLDVFRRIVRVIVEDAVELLSSSAEVRLEKLETALRLLVERIQRLPVQPVARLRIAARAVHARGKVSRCVGKHDRCAASADCREIAPRSVVAAAYHRPPHAVAIRSYAMHDKLYCIRDNLGKAKMHAARPVEKECDIPVHIRLNRSHAHV